MGAVPLHPEQSHQYHQGDANDGSRIEWDCAHVEPFHGAEHGDCGSDEAVTIQEGCSEQPEDDIEEKSRSVFPVAIDQRHEGQNPAFAPIVGPEHQGKIFYGDEKEQCPENHGNDA